MKPYEFISVAFWLLAVIHGTQAECSSPQSVTFERWSGVTPEYGVPVFVYSASGDEDSLTGVCLSRCRELPDCASVVVEFNRGSCHGIIQYTKTKLHYNNDAAYFRKTCLRVAKPCNSRWWALEVTPGHHLHSEGPKAKVILNTSMQDCSEAILDVSSKGRYRSAQWVADDSSLDPAGLTVSDEAVGSCLLHENDKFTEPESYRVANFHTVYIESQCRHDYPKKIDRCSYEEYYNQTLKHVELTLRNYSKDKCKLACENEFRFICRGFTWMPFPESAGICDLHSEDLVTTGSWLLRRTSTATYYRRVTCLNISVECEGSDMIVTYRPRGSFRGRVYTPGHGEECGARAAGAGAVRLALPLYGNCGVNFAFAVTTGPNGVINNRTMAYALLMLQNNPIIQTAGDRWVRVGCSPGVRAPATVDATVNVKDNGKPTLANQSPTGNSLEFPAAASAVFSTDSAPLTMYVVRADENNGPGSVLLGELLELRIETTDQKEIEAYHLVAASRLGDSSVLLLDSRGCPTGQVDFPPFTREWLGGTQRLSARFKAFRFPTSHVVRFAIVIRFCEDKCQPVDCKPQQYRSARQANDSESFDHLYYSGEGIPASVREGDAPPSPSAHSAGVVAQGGRAGCGGGEGKVPLELEMIVGSGDVLSADTMVHADSRAPEEDLTFVSAGGAMGAVGAGAEGSLVCIHELLLVALALAWLAVQVLLLLGCCVLVHRYRNLAEMSMHKDYQSFDNVGFETSSTHRRVHWPDQHLDTVH